MQYYDFITVDFETATNRYDSACAIGISAIKDGKIDFTYYSLIKPPDNYFLEENIKIHGITSEMVESSPELDDIWDEIRTLFESSLVIAHNAYFDMSVLKHSLNQPIENFKYVDSVAIARDFVPGKKSLEHCAQYFGIDMGEHHNALDDAITCAKIVLACLTRSELPHIAQLCFAIPTIKIHNFDELSSSTAYKYGPKSQASLPEYAYLRSKDITPQNTAFDETHPLYKKTIVFTGQLKISRKDAMQLVVDAGAFLKDGISKKVDFLVVGETDKNIPTTKEKKADELNQSGKADIKIISEDDFFNLVKKGET